MKHPLYVTTVSRPAYTYIHHPEHRVTAPVLFICPVQASAGSAAVQGRLRGTENMKVAGFIRAWVSPSGLLLLFLAFTTTTITGVQRADGASYSSQDDSTDNTESCPTEEFACLDDATCSACLDVASTNSAEVNDCVELASSSSSSESSVCTSQMNSPCCVDEASGYECLDNELFLEYMLCVVESEGCFVDEITCDDDVGSELDTASNGATARSRSGSTVAFVGYLLVCLLSLEL